MKALGTVLWHFPFFGFIDAGIVYLMGLLLTVTVVGAPIGLGLMEFGKFLFSPFGKTMVNKKDLNVEQNKSWKIYSTIIMILYLPFGMLLCAAAAIQVFFLCLTIIGIPPAMVIAKSMGTFLNPVNKKCVSAAFAEELERRKVQSLFQKEEAGTRPEGNFEPKQAKVDQMEERVVPPKEKPEGFPLDLSLETTVCPECGMTFPAENKPNFCSSCGTRFEDAAKNSVKLEKTSIHSLSVPVENATEQSAEKTSETSEQERIPSTILSEFPERIVSDNNSKKGYNKKVCVAVLAAAFLGLGGYMLFSRSSSSEYIPDKKENNLNVSQSDRVLEQKVQKAESQGNEEAKKTLEMTRKVSLTTDISDPMRETLLHLVIPKTIRATVSATQVIMRSKPSIHSDREGMLNKGNSLVVLEKWVVDKDNEGILNYDVSTESGYVLKKGRAVTIRNSNSYQRKYEVIVQDARGDVSGWISEDAVKSLKGFPWYRIVQTDGKTGWVLGEFISLESEYTDSSDFEKFDPDKTVKAFSSFMERYAEAMAEAVNCGSITPAAPYINPEGPLFKTQLNIVSDLYKQDIRRKSIEVTVVKATLEGREIVLFVDEKYALYYPGGRVENVQQGYRYRIRRSTGDHESSLRLLYAAGTFS